MANELIVHWDTHGLRVRPRYATEYQMSEFGSYVASVATQECRTFPACECRRSGLRSLRCRPNSGAPRRMQTPGPTPADFIRPCRATRTDSSSSTIAINLALSCVGIRASYPGGSNRAIIPSYISFIRACSAANGGLALHVETPTSSASSVFCAHR